ncbi:hypothetical protein [Actinoplanes sp. NBRC 101535]|uniref:hypothetical protein n=1 Tax=Actinoplanes sp. NBRC 101535 TaxID=3032196 RepID=UPI0024A5BB93|nr:hypothetical protein [Actinoplanes sp. NBRC 101535]GLY03872.1 hypothetical protein Acsp01_42510 [Actinoplanes sp. NBRC 101535]
MRRFLVAAPLVVMPLAACTGGTTEPAAAPSPAVSAVVSLRPLMSPGTGTVLLRGEGQTGPWQGTAGTRGDSGSLDVMVTCVGGGELEVTTTVGASGKTVATTPCAGITMHNRGENTQTGPVTVSIAPSGEQRWSLLVVRDMEVG